MFDGYKTKLSALGIVVAGVLFYLGVVDMAGFTGLVTVFTGTAVYGIKDKIDRD